MENLETAKAFFSNDTYATKTSGIEIVEASNEYAKCVMTADERHMNAGGAVMGGAIFTLADFAFGVVSNTTEMTCVTSTSQITYLNPARPGTLIAEARCIKSGKRTASGLVDITEDGVLVASVSITGVKIPKK